MGYHSKCGCGNVMTVYIDEGVNIIYSICAGIIISLPFAFILGIEYIIMSLLLALWIYLFSENKLSQKPENK